MRITRNPSTRSRGESGQILIMTALLLPVLLGFTALALDVGYAFNYHHRIQTAADAAALAGAYAVQLDNPPVIPQGTLETIVRADATRNLFTHGTDGVTVTVIRSPGIADGFQYNYTGDLTAVGVIIGQPKGTFFMRVLNTAFASLTFSARAVANSGSDTTINIVLLNPARGSLPADLGALWTSGNGNIEVDGDVHVNSTSATAVQSQGGARVTSTGGGRVFLTGNYSGNAPSPLTLGSPPVPDPLAALPEPGQPGLSSGCVGNSCAPGYYPNGLYPNKGCNSCTTTLQPGLYYVEGPCVGVACTGTPPKACKSGWVGCNISVDLNGTVNGSGVTIFVKDGSWGLDENQDTATLTAPTSGTYKGIVIFQSRANGDDASVDKGRFDFSGVVYMHLTGANETSGADLLIGNSTNAGQQVGGPQYTVYIVDALHSGGHTLYLHTNWGVNGSPLTRVSLAE